MTIYMNKLVNQYNSKFEVTGFVVSLSGKDKDNVLNVDLILGKEDFPKIDDLSTLNPKEIQHVAMIKLQNYVSTAK